MVPSAVLSCLSAPVLWAGERQRRHGHASPRPGFSAPAPSRGSGRLCPPRWDQPWERQRSERFACHIGRWKVESVRAPSGPPPDRHAAAPPRGSARPPGGGKRAARRCPLSRDVLRLRLSSVWSVAGPALCLPRARVHTAFLPHGARSGVRSQCSRPSLLWVLTLLSTSPRSLSSFSSHFCLVSFCPDIVRVSCRFECCLFVTKIASCGAGLQQVVTPRPREFTNTTVRARCHLKRRLGWQRICPSVFGAWSLSARH